VGAVFRGPCGKGGLGLAPPPLSRSPFMPRSVSTSAWAGDARKRTCDVFDEHRKFYVPFHCGAPPGARSSRPAGPAATRRAMCAVCCSPPAGVGVREHASGVSRFEFRSPIYAHIPYRISRLQLQGALQRSTRRVGAPSGRRPE
jgi:hypothetical protein